MVRQKFKPNWVASHADKIISRLERDMFPWVGSKPIAELKAPELLLMCLRRVEARGALETAHLAFCRTAVRSFATRSRPDARSAIPSNDLRGALPPVKEKHLASLTDPKSVASLLRVMRWLCRIVPVTLCALRLAPLVFVRPGELRKAEWTEIDLDPKAEWNIAAERDEDARASSCPVVKTGRRDSA